MRRGRGPIFLQAMGRTHAEVRRPCSRRTDLGRDAEPRSSKIDSKFVSGGRGGGGILSIRNPGQLSIRIRFLRGKNNPQRETLLVRGAGLEPARYFYHEPLKLACLPFHHPRTLTAAFARGLNNCFVHCDWRSFRAAAVQVTGSFRRFRGLRPGLGRQRLALVSRSGRGRRRGHRT